MSYGKLQHKNGMTRLSFQLTDDVTLSKPSLAKIQSAGYFVPAQCTEVSGGYTLNYDVGNLDSLWKYLQKSNMTEVEVLQAITSLCNTLAKAEADGFKLQSISFNADTMFWDPTAGQVKLICFPYETGQQPMQSMRAAMLRIAEGLDNVKSCNLNIVTSIQEYCHTQQFNLSEFMSMLESLQLITSNKTNSSENPTDHDSATELLTREDLTELMIAESEQSLTISIVTDGMERQIHIQNFPCIIGRSLQDANMVLEDKSVSRQHAVIDYRETFIITDNNSRNGISINNEKLPPGGNKPLAQGDLIKIGRIEMCIDTINI